MLALRRKVSIKVRQPLTKILIPVLDPAMTQHIAAVKTLIMNEVNVKEIELIENTAGIITKRIKPNFKTLGPRYGKYMKQIAAMTAEFTQERIAEIEAAPETILDLGAEKIAVTPADFEITSEDMPGWLVASEEYPQGFGIRSDGQDPGRDRAEGACGRRRHQIRRLHRIADAGRRGQDRGTTCGRSDRRFGCR